MHLLEREAQLAARSLRALAADLEARLAAGDDPRVALTEATGRLSSVASGLEHELAHVAAARQQQAATQTARGTDRLWRNNR